MRSEHHTPRPHALSVLVENLLMPIYSAPQSLLSNSDHTLQNISLNQNMIFKCYPKSQRIVQQLQIPLLPIQSLIPQSRPLPNCLIDICQAHHPTTLSPTGVQFVSFCHNQCITHGRRDFCRPSDDLAMTALLHYPTIHWLGRLIRRFTVTLSARCHWNLCQSTSKILKVSIFKSKTAWKDSSGNGSDSTVYPRAHTRFPHGFGRAHCQPSQGLCFLFLQRLPSFKYLMVPPSSGCLA